MENELPAGGVKNFHLGASGALLPIITFVSGIVVLAALGTLSSATGGAVAFVSFIVVLVLLKDRSLFVTLVMRGLKNDMLVILLISFLLAGVMAKTMELGGLVDALVWGSVALNVPSWLIPAAFFIIVTLIGLATGTNAGTIVTTLPILLPLGIAMGVDPALVVGAIVGGAMWGDNIAPVSDTTIVSALTQEAAVARVVKAALHR